MANAGFAFVPKRNGSYGASVEDGEENACFNRRNSVSRWNYLAAVCVYDEMFK